MKHKFISHFQIKKLRSCLFALFLGIGLLLYSKNVQKAIYQSMDYCFKLLIPSLFPFIALTSYTIHSPVNTVIGKIFSPVTRRIFKLPSTCSSVIIMSLIGGYPSGAVGISALLSRREITEKQARRMLCFCINPGIAFVITFLGGSVLQNPKTGIFLFFSIVLSSLLIGFFISIAEKPPAENTQTHSDSQKAALVNAAFDSSKVIMKMCACMFIFAAIFSILQSCGLLLYFANYLHKLLSISVSESFSLLFLLSEIAGGVQNASVNSVLPAIYYAFALAFGGICVHMQILSFFEKFPMKISVFIIFRVFHAFLASFIFSIFARTSPDVQSVFISTAKSSYQVHILSTSAGGGFLLFLMCAAFLLISNKSDARNICRI